MSMYSNAHIFRTSFAGTAENPGMLGFGDGCTVGGGITGKVRDTAKGAP